MQGVPLAGGFHLRSLELEDFTKGYLNLLSQLTVVGDISQDEFQGRASELLLNEDYQVVVIEDGSSNRIVGTGTLLVERKIIRKCGKVGHIEDIVVDSSVRGQHMGQRIIEELTRLARDAGCYKVILDCSEENAPFYERCGYKRKELQMAQYFN